MIINDTIACIDVALAFYHQPNLRVNDYIRERAHDKRYRIFFRAGAGDTSLVEYMGYNIIVRRYRDGSVRARTYTTKRDLLYTRPCYTVAPYGDGWRITMGKHEL